MTEGDFKKEQQGEHPSAEMIEAYLSANDTETEWQMKNHLKECKHCAEIAEGIQQRVWGRGKINEQGF